MAELTRLGRYQLVRVLGRGAMGVVYEGHDPALNRRVAVKTILRNAAIDEETARGYSAQFTREAQAAGRLNHPNIVHVHDFAVEGEVAYLVMEYIQGRELRSFFEAKERFEPAEAVRVMGELLDALDFAHEAGVIHRDVKPANVMLDAQRRVKLADFGVARIQDSERSAAGTMVGTPAFMSPEQISGGKIDRRTDIFSAGVVLYQLLTGEQPFTGAGAWTVAKKIMQDDPPWPSTVAVSVSPAFDAIVNKALAKTPAERYASAREFAAALRGVGASAQPPATATLPPGQPAAGAGTSRPGAKATEAEVEFWRAIQNSSDPAEFEFYLEQFPDGTYAGLARHKIAKLKEPAETARKEAEENARREEEEERARIKAEAEAFAKAEAAERVKKETEEKAKREAQERARREAEQRARVEAEVKARREAADKAKREQQAKAAQPPVAAPEKKKSFVLPAIIGVAVVVAGVAVFLVLNRKAPPPPVAEAPAPVVAKPAPPAVDEGKIRREIEERLRREYADKTAAEQAAAKAAAEKAITEKVAAEKAAVAKAAAEKAAIEKAAADKAQAEKLAVAKSANERAALEKAAADKAAAEKAAAERLAVEKAAAEKTAAEKAVADKLAAEKIAADKAAAEKAAAEKAAAAARKPGWPAVGDRWVYEAREPNHPDRRQQIQVEVQSVAAGGVRDLFRSSAGLQFAYMHKPGAYIVGGGNGIGFFSPYLRMFQELREGQSWSNIEFERLGGCSSDPGVLCAMNAKVVGREKVTVKAGSYDAWKIEVENRVKTPGPSRFYAYTFWYSEAARRTVKFQGRMRSGGGGAQSPDIDMELVSYTPAGG